MARDDYFVIAYKILIYLYACKKRKIVFDEALFRKAAGADGISEEYFVNILRMAQTDGLIEGLVFTKAWGDTWILSSELRCATITSAGIAYLSDNSKAAAIRKMLVETADIIADLIGIVGL